MQLISLSMNPIITFNDALGLDQPGFHDILNHSIYKVFYAFHMLLSLKVAVWC